MQYVLTDAELKELQKTGERYVELREAVRRSTPDTPLVQSHEEALAVLADRLEKAAEKRPQAAAPASGAILPSRPLTIKEFAQRWSVSTRQVHHWLTRGLPAVRAGRVVRILVSEADEWLATAPRSVA